MPLNFNKESLSFAVKRRKKAADPDQQTKDPVPERRDEGTTVKRRVPVSQSRAAGPATKPRSKEPTSELRDGESNPEHAGSGPGSPDQTPEPSDRGPPQVDSPDPDPAPDRPR